MTASDQLDADGSTAPGRYGQLTYTSFDDSSDSGGWRVKEEIDLDEDEVGVLRARVSTRLDPGHELPRFPSPDDVAAFPRRLVYAPTAAGAAWWHTAPAGNDASGRPGNVFVHVVLDRSPDESRTIRPVDLWRSPDWLCPFGPDEVRGATLDRTGEPGRGDVITLQAVIAFLLDLEEFRLGTLAALLDACATAMGGGPPVVLGVADVDRAALWIAAVSYLMPVHYARRHFFFSTLERVATIEGALAEGIQLACVPREDLEGWAPASSAVVLDESESIDLGDLGGQPHRTSRGHEILVTEWSAMAQVLLIDGAMARAGLARLDLLMSDLVDAGSEPAWGLAILVSTSPDLHAEAGSEATSVILRASPAQLTSSAEPRKGATDLLHRQLGGSVSQAWQGLEQAPAGSAASELLLGIYAALAVQDLEWLSQPGGAPVPPLPRVDPAASTSIALAARHTLIRWNTAALREDHAQLGLATASMANIAAQLELHDDGLDDELCNALERWFVYRLLDEEAAAMVVKLGVFAEETQHTYLRPLVEVDQAMHNASEPGCRLSPAVTLWLYPERPSPVRLEAGLDLERLRLRAELAAHLVAADPGSTTTAGERPLVVWATLAERPDSERELEHLFRGPAWEARDLLQLERRYSRRIPLDWFGPTLKAAPASAELTELCLALLRRRSIEQLYGGPSPIFSLAELRGGENEVWPQQRGQDFDLGLTAVLEAGVYAAELHEVPFEPELRLQLMVAVVIAGVLDRHERPRELVRSAIGGDRWGFTARQCEQIKKALDANARLVDLVLLSMAGDPKFPIPQLYPPERSWLSSCLEAASGETPFLWAYLRRRFSEFPIYAEEVKRNMRSHVEPLLQTTVTHPDKEARAVERFTLAWLRTLQQSDAAHGRRKARI